MIRLITILYRGEECTRETSRELVEVLAKAGLCEDGNASVVKFDESCINEETPKITLSRVSEKIQSRVNVILEYFVKMQSYSKYPLLVELIEQTNSFTNPSELRAAVNLIGPLSYEYVESHIRKDCGYNEKMHDCVKEVCKIINS